MERKFNKFEWAFGCATNAGAAILGAIVLWCQLSHSLSLNAVAFSLTFLFFGSIGAVHCWRKWRAIRQT